MNPEINRPEPAQNTPANQRAGGYASELDGGQNFTVPTAVLQDYAVAPAGQPERRSHLLTTAYRSHLWGLIWTVIILLLLALFGGLAMKLVGKWRQPASVVSTQGSNSLSAPSGSTNQLLTVNGQLKVTGLTTLQSGLKVSGPTNLQGDVSLGGNLSVAKDASVAGTLTAGGLKVNGGITAPSFQGGNFTGGSVSTTTISASGAVTASSFAGNGAGLTGVNAATLGGQPSSYYLNASNIAAGVLGVQYGGTGASTASGARSNLGAAAAGANSDITSLSGLTTPLSMGQGGTGVNASSAANGQLLIGNGSGFTLANLTQGSGISIANTSGGITIAVDSTVCTTAGNCGTGSGGGITGSGTASTIAMFTGAGVTLGNSLLSQSGSTVSVLGDLTASGAFTASSAAISGAVTAGSFTGNGAGLTNVNAASLGGQPASYYTNASSLSSGTLADTRLSTNVTLQGNSFNGPDQLVKLTATGIISTTTGTTATDLMHVDYLAFWEMDKLNR